MAHKMMTRLSLIAFLLFFFTSITRSQDEGPYLYKPLKLQLDEIGDAYIRFILWNQAWATTNNISDPSTRLQLSASIRRARLITYAQMSPKFLVLTHVGLNSLTGENLTALGSDGNSSQIFLHAAWGEYKVNESIFVGAGLHYWNGLTRLASQSTISFMTLDQSRPFYAWHSIGISDQFGRHLGVYLKGVAGKVDYRIALNNPGRSPLGNGIDYSANFNPDGEPLSSLVYRGVSTPDEKGYNTGNTILTGYAKYNFLENESVKLPYYSGTYLGKKEVIAFGTGFFWHPNGMYDTESEQHTSIFHFAADLFVDLPVSGGAVNGYLSYTSFDYGRDYMSRWAGTGNVLYGHFGYYYKRLSTMPYIGYSYGQFEGAPDPVKSLNVGVNYFLTGHHCKLTVEWYQLLNDFREKALILGDVSKLSQVRVQIQVAL